MNKIAETFWRPSYVKYTESDKVQTAEIFKIIVENFGAELRVSFAVLNC
jgi:hypothetical protein